MKPLDKIVIAGGDTCIILSHAMLKKVNLLIARQYISAEHIDSLRTIIKTEQSMIFTYRSIVESMKRENEIWQDMNTITTKQLLEEKRKVKIWKGISYLGIVVIFVETILLSVSSIH